jgi:hypothetical protein
MNTQETLLEKFRLVASVRIPLAHLNALPANSELKVLTDEVDYLTLRLSAEVAGKRLSSVQWPEDWWQAVKLRFAPRWFLKRWPVKFVVFEARAFLPRLALPPRSVGLVTCALAQLDGKPVDP